MGGKVRQIVTMTEFQGELQDAGAKLVVVDFWASWCGPCIHIAPYYEYLSQDPEFESVVFLKVDVDNNVGISAYASVRAMPTFQFFLNGKLVDSFEGASEEKLFQKIKQHKIDPHQSTREQTRSLLASEKLPKETYQVLRSIITNICKFPQDQKYRKLKLSNVKVAESVAKHETAMTLLYTIGFEATDDDDDLITLSDKNLDVGQLQAVLSEVQNKI
jgi:thioredoxin 1